MAAEFPLRKEQLIFLINNYDMMLAVLMVSLQSRPKSISVALRCYFSKVIAGTFITMARSAVGQKTEKKKHSKKTIQAIRGSDNWVRDKPSFSFITLLGQMENNTPKSVFLIVRSYSVCGYYF